MKSRIKNILMKLGNALFEKDVLRNQAVNRQSQIMLSLAYKDVLERGGKLPEFDDVEFRSFSQNGEDGILLFIFSLIGTTNKKAVEVCAGDGIVCNTANLIINHGWLGLLLDGDNDAIARGVRFYQGCRDTYQFPPILKNAWITAENINEIISSEGFDGEVDLLSIDMDGIDYWVWNAIDCIRPRVVVVEYNKLLGPNRSVTVPNKPEFKIERIGRYAVYCGASLGAFVNLAKKKGYRLVGCQRYGYNAFFIRDDLGDDVLPETTVEKCFQNRFIEYSDRVREVRDMNEVLGKEWIEVYDK